MPHLDALIFSSNFRHFLNTNIRNYFLSTEIDVSYKSNLKRKHLSVAYESQDWKLLELILIVVFALSATYAVYAYRSNRNNNSGKQPWGVAYDSSKGEIFVVNTGDNTVSVISDNTNNVVATINVGTSPNSITYYSAKSEYS